MGAAGGSVAGSAVGGISVAGSAVDGISVAGSAVGGILVAGNGVGGSTVGVSAPSGALRTVATPTGNCARYMSTILRTKKQCWFLVLTLARLAHYRGDRNLSAPLCFTVFWLRCRPISANCQPCAAAAPARPPMLRQLARLPSRQPARPQRLSGPWRPSARCWAVNILYEIM